MATILEGKQRKIDSRKRKYGQGKYNSGAQQKLRYAPYSGGHTHHTHGGHNHGGNGKNRNHDNNSKSGNGGNGNKHHPAPAQKDLTGGLPQELVDDLRDLRLEIVPRGYVAALEVQSTLAERIREAQKLDKEIDQIKKRMTEGKAKGFRKDEYGAIWFEDRTAGAVAPELDRRSPELQLTREPSSLPRSPQSPPSSTKTTPTTPSLLRTAPTTPPSSPTTGAAAPPSPEAPAASPSVTIVRCKLELPSTVRSRMYAVD
nr:uncharacterized protein LOC120967811 [Aegilops tauschii subsp. strangulata]